MPGSRVEEARLREDVLIVLSELWGKGFLNNMGGAPNILKMLEKRGPNWRSIPPENKSGPPLQGTALTHGGDGFQLQLGGIFG